MKNQGNLLYSKGIYLLPNIFTTAALFAAFFSIIASIGGRFESAAIALYIAMLMDGLDGRVARLTHTQTAFGAEFDSLSDMVAFGVAPAVLIYVWSLSSLGRLGWLASFIYVAAAALRLARFNTERQKVDSRYFKGLSSTLSAGVVSGLVWLGEKHGFSGTALSVGVLVVVLSIAVLMVTNLLYYSFKQFDFKGKVPFVMILLLVGIFVLVALEPPEVLFTVFCLYALSAPVWSVVRWVRKLRRR